MRPRRAFRVSALPSAPRTAELRHLHPTPQPAEWRTFIHHDFGHYLKVLLSTATPVKRLTARDATRRRTAVVIRHQGRYLRNVEGTRRNQVVRCTIALVSAFQDKRCKARSRSRCDGIAANHNQSHDFSAFGSDRHDGLLRGRPAWRANMACAQALPVRLRRRATWVMQGR